MSRVETLRETVFGNRVKGLLVRAHLEWVREYFGERMMTRVLSILPPQTAIEANGALDSGWCAFETLVLLDRAIAEVCGGRDAQIPRELGRYTAHLALAAGKHSLRREDIHRFCRCSVVRDPYLQGRGFASYEEVSPFQGRVIVRDSAALSPIICLGVTGYFEQLLAAHGGRDVSVTESSCQCRGDDACVFDLSWR